MTRPRLSSLMGLIVVVGILLGLGLEGPKRVIAQERTVKSLSSTTDSTCAVLHNDQVKCWGQNAYGSCGVGYYSSGTDGVGAAPNQMGNSLPAVPLGTGRFVKQVSIGDIFTCMLLSDDKIYCFGYEGRGYLGREISGWVYSLNDLGDGLDAAEMGSGLKPTSVTSGWYHSCATLNDSSVKCWGDGNHGALGFNSSSAAGGRDWGIAPNQMGNALPKVALGVGRTALAVGVGMDFTCVLLNAGDVKCFGYNGNGRLGLGSLGASLDARTTTLGDSMPVVALGSGVSAKSLSVGARNVCVITNTNAVKCWGSNTYGQTGLGVSFDWGTSSLHMGDGLPSVALGASRTAKFVTSGIFHTCAILDNDSLKCWGLGDRGQLGWGNATLGTSPTHMGDALPAVRLGTGRTAKAVVVGHSHTCVLLDTGLVVCFGANDSGQLGRGNQVDSGSLPSTMGDGLVVTSVGTFTSSPSSSPSRSPVTSSPSRSPATSFPSRSPSRRPTNAPTNATNAPTRVDTPTSAPSSISNGTPTSSPTSSASGLQRSFGFHSIGVVMALWMIVAW